MAREFKLKEYLQCPYMGRHDTIKWEPGTKHCCYCMLVLPGLDKGKQS